MTKKTVPVKIQGRDYRIRSDGAEDLVKEAAKLVDETMGELRNRASAVDSLDVAVLEALYLANRLIVSSDTQVKQSGFLEEESALLQALIELVEESLLDRNQVSN